MDSRDSILDHWPILKLILNRQLLLANWTIAGFYRIQFQGCNPGVPTLPCPPFPSPTRALPPPFPPLPAPPLPLEVGPLKNRGSGGAL